MVCPCSRPRLRLAPSLRSPRHAGSPGTVSLRYSGVKGAPQHPSRSSAATARRQHHQRSVELSEMKCLEEGGHGEKADDRPSNQDGTTDPTIPGGIGGWKGRRTAGTGGSSHPYAGWGSGTDTAMTLLRHRQRPLHETKSGKFSALTPQSTLLLQQLSYKLVLPAGCRANLNLQQKQVKFSTDLNFIHRL